MENNDDNGGNDTYEVSAGYEVSVDGDIFGDEQIVIGMPLRVNLTDLHGKDAISAYNTIPEILVTANDLKNSGPLKISGYIKANDASAGEWTGNLTFNIQKTNSSQEITLTASDLEQYMDESGTLTIPDNINGVPVTRLTGAFHYSSRSNELKSVIFPSTVISDNKVFDSCSNLTSVTFNTDSEGNGIKYIGGFGYTNLSSITLPDSVEYIKHMAFRNTDITSVNIPKKTSVIMPYAFASRHLTSITVDDENPIYTSKIDYYTSSEESNMVVEKSTKTLIQGCKETGSLEYANNIAIIGQYAFCNVDLTAITLPIHNLKEIRDYAFINQSDVGISLNYEDKLYNANTFDSLTEVLKKNGIKVGKRAFHF